MIVVYTQYLGILIRTIMWLNTASASASADLGCAHLLHVFNLYALLHHHINKTKMQCRLKTL